MGFLVRGGPFFMVRWQYILVFSIISRGYVKVMNSAVIVRLLSGYCAVRIKDIRDVFATKNGIEINFLLFLFAHVYFLLYLCTQIIKLSTINCQLSTVNYQLSTVNYQLSTINYQLSTINYQLSTINYQLSTINCQLSTVNCYAYFQPYCST